MAKTQLELLRMLYIENSVFVILQRLRCQKLSAILGIRKGVNTEFLMILDTQTQYLIALLLSRSPVRICFNMET